MHHPSKSFDNNFTIVSLFPDCNPSITTASVQFMSINVLEHKSPDRSSLQCVYLSFSGNQ
jgi:hypothetical protein